jgi:uncharacterized protein
VQLSPFDYTGPLPPERVQGRDGLLVDLTERVTARRPTALLGPRRFGKTSVLRRLAADLTEITTITVDLMPVQSAHDAVRALVDALLGAEPGVASEAERVTASLGFNLGVLRGEIRSTRVSERPDANVAFQNLVEALAQTALRQPTLVVFDEFQQIAALANGTAVLRTHLQDHYKEIGLVFAGSAPSAMRDIFASHDQPFLHQVDIVEIGALSLPAVIELVRSGFGETGREPGALAGLVHQFTGGHPLRTMQAAHAAWTFAEGQAGDAAWGEAVESLRRTYRATVSVFYEQLGSDQQKLLRVLANGGSPFGSAGRVLELSKGGAATARSTLLAEGHLLEDEGRLVVTDPFLVDWLRTTLPL